MKDYKRHILQSQQTLTANTTSLAYLEKLISEKEELIVSLKEGIKHYQEENTFYRQQSSQQQQQQQQLQLQLQQQHQQPMYQEISSNVDNISPPKSMLSPKSPKRHGTSESGRMQLGQQSEGEEELKSVYSEEIQSLQAQLTETKAYIQQLKQSQTTQSQLLGNGSVGGGVTGSNNSMISPIPRDVRDTPISRLANSSHHTMMVSLSSRSLGCNL